VGEALVHIPVLFDSGQRAGPRSVSRTIVDLPIELVLEPQWRWDFGDGSTDATRSAEVGHTYRSRQAHRARVAAVWLGRYWVAGLGPLQIDQPVTQEASLAVSVGEGRATLVR